MKKILIGLALLSGTLSAQEIDFNHSWGMSYIGGIYSTSEVPYDIYYPEDYPMDRKYTFVGFTYNPRVDLDLAYEWSLSLTAYPSYIVNFSGSHYNHFNDPDDNFLLSFDIPMGVQLNYGNHSSYRSDKDLGYFVMAGYNYGAYRGLGRIQSVCLQAGMKFYIRDESFGVRVEYNIPMNLEKTEKLQLFGIGLLYNIYR